MRIICFIIPLIYLFSIVVTDACLISGCLSCQQSLCDECSPGFSLNISTRTCTYQLCESYQAYQQEVSSCMAICSETTNVNSISNTCEASNKCPLSFLQATGINRSSSIVTIVDGGENQLFVLYQTFVNSIDKKNGAFQRQYTFDSLAISILHYPQNQVFATTGSAQKLYLLTENTLSHWDPQENITTLILKLTSSVFKRELSNFIAVANNQNKFVITSQGSSSSEIILIDILTSSIIASIILEFNQSIGYSESSLIIKNDEKSTIQIYQIIENPDKELQLTAAFQSFVCGSPTINSKLITIIFFDDYFYAIFKQTAHLFRIKKSLPECFSQSMVSMPLRMIQFEVQFSTQNYNFLAVSFSDYSIQILEMPTLLQLFTFTPTFSFIDFFINSKSNEIISLFVLSSVQQQLVYYEFSYINSEFLLTKTSYTNILISSPSQIIYLPGTSSPPQPSLAVISQDLQIILASSQKTLLLVKDFKDKVFQNEGSISSIAYAEYLSFILSCSSDGKLVIWSGVETLNPVFLYSISKTSQKCKKVLIFNKEFAVVLFSTEINIIQIPNPDNVQIIPITNPTSLSVIQVQNNLIYILKDSTVLILNGINSIVFDSSSIPIYFTSITSFVVVPEGNIFMITNYVVLCIYSLQQDYSLSQLPIYTYLSQALIIFHQIIPKSNGSFSVFLNTSSKQIAILNSHLTKTFEYPTLDGIVTGVFTVDEELKFFFNFFLADTTIVYRFRTIFLDTTTFTASLVGSHISILGFSQLIKRTNVNGDLGYQLIAIIPLIYTSLSLYMWWTPGTQTIVGAFEYAPSSNVVSLLSNSEQDLTILGSSTGEVKISQAHKINNVQIIAKSNSNFSYDSILQIIPSFYHGSLYVVSNKVDRYNLFTDDFIETYNFSSTTLPILSIYPATQTLTLVVCNSQELILRNIADSRVQILSTLNPSDGFGLSYISGFFMNETLKIIYIYGDGLYSAPILNVQAVRLMYSHVFQSCSFLDQIAVCRINSNQILFLNPIADLKQIQIVTVPSTMGKFAFQIDTSFEYIYIFNSITQIYSFKGVLLQTKTYSKPVLQITFCGQNFLVLNQSTAFIYLRSNLSYLTSFTPPGGSFIGGIYVPSHNVFAYYCDDIRYGQVFLYSFQSFEISGTIINTFPGNGIGKVVTEFFDNDNLMLNYIDRYGNNQMIDNIIGIEEIMAEKTPAPIDQILEYNTNNFYIHNGVFVWKFNYNQHTRPLQRLLLKKPTLYIQTSVTSFLIVDYSNTIFSYSNLQLTYSSDFLSPILNMKVLPTSKLVLLVFQDKIFIYPSSFSTLTQENKVQVLLNTRTNEIFLIEPENINSKEDRVIFSTYQNQIIDYNFSSSQELGSFHLDPADMICATLSFRTSEDWYFIFGTITGKYGIYNMNSKSSFISSPTIDQQYQPVQFINRHPMINDSIILVYKSGKILSLTPTGNGIVISVDTTISDTIFKIKNTIIPIQFLHFSKSTNRLYVNFKESKVMFVFQLNTKAFLMHISFPDDQWKRIDENSRFLILSSAAQSNIYNQLDLSFIGRVRRQNRKDFIVDQRIVDPNLLVIEFTSRIEILFIYPNSVTLIDQITSITDPTLLKVEINENDNSLYIIGFSKVSMFEKIISVSLFQQSYEKLAYSTKTELNCETSLSYQNDGSSQNYLDFMTSPSTLVSSLNYILNVHIQDEIKNFSFLNRSSLRVILRPTFTQVSQKSQTLKIFKESFLNLPFNINLDAFEFKFIDLGTSILFHNKSTNITLQNIFISNQLLPIGTQILFSNKEVVSIKNMAVDNIQLTNSTTQSMRYLQILSERTPFLSFNSCSFVIIDQLTIVNSQFDTLFISSNKSTMIIIKNLLIEQTTLFGFAQFYQNKKVTLKNVEILNCRNSDFSSIIRGSIIFDILGVLISKISNLKIQNVNDLQLIQSNKSYKDGKTQVSLEEDILQLDNLVLIQNKFPQTLSKDFQPHFLDLESSIISMSQLIYQNNQGNIYVKGAIQFQLSSSEFTSNSGVNGSCVQVDQILESFLIDTTTFTENSVSASGGAIYLFNVNNPIISSSCLFSKNSAEIGGAIRLKSDSVTSIDVSLIQAIFIKNTAGMFGKDIGTFLNFFMIYRNTTSSSLSSSSESISSFVYQGDIFTQDPVTINFDSVQSGGILFLDIILKDQYGEIFTFETKKYLNEEYSIYINQELDQYQIEFYQVYSNEQLNSYSQLLEIKGQSLLFCKQFDSSTKSFRSTSLILSSRPLNSVSIGLIKLTFNQYFVSTGIPIFLKFRDCQAGEIYQSLSLGFIVCTLCLDGTYSLRDSNSQSYSFQKRQEEFSICQTCPATATKCSGNSIELKPGYWRINSTSDIIVLCPSKTFDVCDEANPEARDGCLGGHTGPLCEQCDLTERVWGTVRYSPSFSQVDCSECSDISLQISFISIGMLAITMYLISSVIMFMNNYKLNSLCVYLRLLKVIPLSTSSVLDESAFFVKSLLNYFQLSSVLFTYSVPSIPISITLFPQVAGQPVSQVILNTACVYNKGSLSYYGDERLRIISQAFYPIGIFFTILAFLKICEKLKRLEVGKYHKYTMINVVFFFFQPDSIALFTNALSCRQIGGEKYETINLSIPCGESSFRQFGFLFVLPNLVFWVMFPTIIFYFFRKRVNQSDNLHFCTMKYKYGFFFLGFKKEYYYWEFVRVYFKILIVIIITLLKENGTMVYCGCIILICLYILLVQRVQPFERKPLLSLEVLSYLVLVPNIFFSQLSTFYNYQIFQIIIMLVHFGYLIYTLLVIIWYKANSQNKGSSRLIRIVMKFILPLRVYQEFTKGRFKNHFRTLMRWRLIYSNISFICSQEQTRLTQARSYRRQTSPYSPDESPRKKYLSGLQLLPLQMSNSVCSEMMAMSSRSIPQILRVPEAEDFSTKKTNLFHPNFVQNRDEKGSPAKRINEILAGDLETLTQSYQI